MISISSLYKEKYTKRQRLSPKYSCPELNSLVTYHTLQSLYVCVWLVNTSTTLTGSTILCTWAPADVCEQWERNLTTRFSRRSWARNASRTPKNVCVGGYLNSLETLSFPFQCRFTDMSCNWMSVFFFFEPHEDERKNPCTLHQNSSHYEWPPIAIELVG